MYMGWCYFSHSCRVVFRLILWWCTIEYFKGLLSEISEVALICLVWIDISVDAVTKEGLVLMLGYMITMYDIVQ